MQPQPSTGTIPQAPDPNDPRNALFWRIVDHLTPLFGGGPTDARLAACTALASCHPEAIPQATMDVLDAGRILAFSLAALAALGQAAQPDTSPETAVRLFGTATRLSQTAAQADRAIRQRRRPLRSAPPAEPRQPAPPPPNPQRDAAMDALLDATLNELFSSARPQPAPAAAHATRAHLSGKPSSAMPAGLKAALRSGAAMPPNRDAPFATRTG